MNTSIISKTSLLCGNTFQVRFLSLTPVNNLIQRWREDKGLPMNPNQYGPLTDGRDYTFLDGRPTPLGMRLKRRMNKQKELAMRVIQLTKEIDHAEKRYNDNVRKQEDDRQRILDHKLKRKGHLLLKKE